MISVSANLLTIKVENLMEKNNAKSVSCGANMRKKHEKIMMTHNTNIYIGACPRTNNVKRNASLHVLRLPAASLISLELIATRL